MRIYDDSKMPPLVIRRFWLGQPVYTIFFDVVEEDGVFSYSMVEMPPFVWSYGEIVSVMVREKYGQDSVEALTNNYLANQSNISVSSSYTEMQQYRGKCKVWAREMLRYSIDNDIMIPEFADTFDPIENTRSMVLQKIQNYDMSDNVNGFFLNGSQLWLTKPMRESLLTSLNMFAKAGVDTFPFVLGDVAMELPCATLEQMLAAVEVYATQCMMVTAGHTAKVNAMRSEQRMLDYDFTKGYPEMLEFDV